MSPSRLTGESRLVGLSACFSPIPLEPVRVALDDDEWTLASGVMAGTEDA